MEYATRLIMHEDGECIAAAVIQQGLHPRGEQLCPPFAVFFNHCCVPGFFEPRPIVLLAWRKASFIAREAVQHFETLRPRVGTACIAGAQPQHIERERAYGALARALAFNLLQARPHLR